VRGSPFAVICGPMPHATPPADPDHAFFTTGDDTGVDEPLTRQEIIALPEVVTWEGRYVIGVKLGEGGMSVVHEADDLLLGRTVALKALRRSGHPPAALLAREARALAAVDHPAVVRVHSVYLDADPPFLAMERARGRSLSALLAGGRLPVPRALGILRQVASGLDALHDAGIVHGDVKPANVMVDQDDVAKLIDVGLGPFLERAYPGNVVGTPSYMPPERAIGADTPPALAFRSDVYSFGVLCFEMLTGRLPFLPSSAAEVLRAHATHPPPLASEVAGLSTEFDAPLAAALAKSPEERPSRCSDLVLALDRASQGADAIGRRIRMVVADDDEAQRTLYVAVLAAHFPGASVALCATGQSVLEAVATDSPTVVVLDLGMPEVWGIDLVRQVRSVAPRVAIVIVTGGGSGTEREAARDLGVRRFLVKPVEVDELVLAVREAVDRAEPVLFRTASRGAIRL
jgi:CheY-like chemotaxis protein